MLDKLETVKYLRMSLVLKDPDIETDEAFKFTDDELWSIIQLVIPNHNPSYTVENYPINERYFAVLLAKKEVYYRLATASAPFYPLKAEGAELRKDYRFQHYLALIRRVEAEYTLMWDKFDSNRTIEIGDVLLQSKHFTARNYQLATIPTVELSIGTVRSDSIDVSWTKFDVPVGMFSNYSLYISETPIYDEYENTIDRKAKKVAFIIDYHRDKYRIKGLTPSTTYFVAIVSEDINKLKGVSEIVVETLDLM